MDDSTSTLSVKSGTKFAMTPRWVARAGKALSPNAKALYTVIMTYADNNSRSAFPGQERLGADLGVSVSTVHRAMKELEAFGALEVERRRKPGTGNFYPNRYTLVFDEPQTSDDDRTPRSHPSVTSESGGPSPVTAEVDPVLPTPSSPIAVPVPETPVPSLRSPSPSGRRADQEARDRLLPLVREVARAEAWDDYDKAAEAFLGALEDEGIEDPGFWDYGWSEKLDSHIRRHGVDYGTAKWLGIYLNAARAA